MIAFGLSETGPVRRMNEDCFVSAEDLRLFIVADGMGGHAAGEVAARIAVESIEKFIRRSHDTDRFFVAVRHRRRRCPTTPTGSRPPSAWPTGASTASPKTTTTIWAWAPRSSARCVTRRSPDRGARRRQPPLSQRRPGPRAAHPRRLVGRHRVRRQRRQQRIPATRHVLTNVLGVRPDTQVHLLEREICRRRDAAAVQRRATRIGVRTKSCGRSWRPTQELPALAQSLISTALDQGSRDNITALVVRCSR